MRLRSRVAVASVGLVLVGGTIGGCGGGDSEDESLSKTEYITQVDELCADNNANSAEISAEISSALDAGDNEAAADLVEENTEATIAMIDEIDELNPPEEDQATIDELFAISDEQQALAGDLADTVRAGDQAGTEQVSSELSALSDEFNAIADEYGFVDCGSAGDA